MNAVILRPEESADREAIATLVTAAFGQEDEARLVEKLHADGDVVLSLVAERDGALRGHILFSRLIVEQNGNQFPAVALAPVSVHPEHQREGIGGALIEEAHLQLERAGERLSIVLGDTAYYGRFGYSHERAAGFESAYQSQYLQARAWGEAPTKGRLIYPTAFSALG